MRRLCFVALATLVVGCTVYSDGAVLVTHDTFVGRWQGIAQTTAGRCGDFTVQLVTIDRLFYQATLIDDQGHPHTVSGSTQADGEFDGRAARGYAPAPVLAVAPLGAGKLTRTDDTIFGNWGGGYLGERCEGTVRLTRLR